ncbi:ATP-binding cassette domain-containing protein [Streptomyces sp. NPDC087538]|uniref:ATP-binding cassette domain-containing protein n=1 Tax=Streptomyces sp. NPDC087538 TaxID=3365797 RepID=UPI00381977A3
MTAPATTTRTPLMSVRGLTKDFRMGGLFSRDHHRALNAVDLDILHGRIVALVRESGSGKSTLARCLARLEQPTSGQVLLDGQDVLRTQRRGASRAYRGTVQMVFQDPLGSLNPVHRVSTSCAAPCWCTGGPRARANCANSSPRSG